MPTESNSATPEFKELLADCLARVEHEGPNALEELCAAHPNHAEQLKRRVSLLRDAGLIAARGEGSERQFPERLGDFRLLRKLGAGGMGDVYLAEQKSPVYRHVALKVIRLGMELVSRGSPEPGQCS